ncbi:hypothetical protein [Bacteroides pyogenes]|uniref:hypothetical protein n=1 Tax=Bacteroides pyogenes TaxID=310300 RepID=UPI001BABD95D|nr:hypothetical protein [Bacteroides pyogenes]MBR8707058.1 hypothetical protein [Bacteroides pyogenes]
MRITKKVFDGALHMWLMKCPLCGDILHSAPEADWLPEFAICPCDRNDNKQSAYELFERNGETWIRRNKYPRFIARVAFEGISDIDNVEMIDECDNERELASAMRKAGEFLVKRSRNE